ncbi:methyltransferase domain-containing protein [Diaminobutyricimonas sp. TR449]|uniref:methyltransferase domain-containing protein n=1 Tax=Diaminobutyricimonas sp. TR449 TaxID=2708076 RepID=UPI001423E631|nr:methyltransferase domain-containing protein [Diaminobutyricimonas sp. TR449]
MDDCCGPEGSAEYAEVFDERFARGVARRYRRRGLTRTARLIVDYAESADPAGVSGASVLEVGGGVGEIQLELLSRGAGHAVNLELSPGYESEAARLIAEADVADQVTRRVGVDIAREPARVEPADIVVLHRVVCCYPDVDQLLAAAANHAKRLVVFSYPAATWFARMSVGMSNFFIRRSGRTYQGYVHSPEHMLRILRRQGFELRKRQRGLVWSVVAAARTATS